MTRDGVKMARIEGNPDDYTSPARTPSQNRQERPQTGILGKDISCLKARMSHGQVSCVSWPGDSWPVSHDWCHMA